MTNDVTQPETAVRAPAARASIGTVLRDQRKTLIVAGILIVAPIWILGALGEWRLAFALALGVALGLVNHLATEYWLLRIITSGIQPSRNAMVRSTISRLVVLTVVGLGVAVLMWPDGLGVLFGLAIFRLIALTMTSLPLLKELKSE